MKIKMRPLKTKDIFPMSRILKKLEIKSTLKGLENKNQSELGYEVIMTAIENLHMAEAEVNEFLAGLVSLSKEEFSELDFADFIGVIQQFKEQKGISDFLKSASQ